MKKKGGKEGGAFRLRTSQRGKKGPLTCGFTLPQQKKKKKKGSLKEKKGELAPSHSLSYNQKNKMVGRDRKKGRTLHRRPTYSKKDGSTNSGGGKKKKEGKTTGGGGGNGKNGH